MLQLASATVFLAFLAQGAFSALCTADIPYCAECDSAGTKCTTCAANFFLLKNNGGCGWACNTSSDMIEGNLENPYYVPHAVTCREDGYTVPTPVSTCEPGYFRYYLGDEVYTCLRCTYAGLADEDNHCATCEYSGYSAPRCTSCMPGWANTLDFCNVPGDCKNGGSRVIGCVTCQTSNPTACAACSAGYFLQNGDCIPAVLYPASEAYVENCAEASPNDPFNCTGCVVGYGRLNLNSNACSKCEKDSVGDVSGQHCAKCSGSSYSSVAYCDACMPGYTDSYSFCSKTVTCKSVPTQVYDCNSCDATYPLKCASCYSGSLFDPNNPYVCYAGCNTSIPGLQNDYYIPHCVKCSNYYRDECTKCEPGWVPSEGDGYSSDSCVKCEKAGVTENLSDQHCATCSMSYWGDEVQSCYACLDGWASPSTFCSEPATCITASKPIKNCVTCETLTTCSACSETFQLSPDKTQCLPVCNITGNAAFISNCIECREYEGQGNQCSVCKAGYYVSDDEKSCLPCTNPDVGDVSKQHCASCYSSYSGGLICSACAGEWDDTSAFCNVTYSCVGSNSRIPNCVSCQTADPSLCGVCAEYYVLSEDGRKCTPMCEGDIAVNPWAVEHCTVCYSYDPRLCSTCEDGYNYAQGGKFCAPAGTCSPPLPNCNKCLDTSASTCEVCASGSTLFGGKCFANCGGQMMMGCVACSATDSTKCETCDSSFIKAPDGSYCCHKNCCKFTNGYMSECNGHGICEVSSTGYASCDCSDYPNSDAITSYGDCGCSYGYVSGPNGECMRRMEGCGAPMDHCTSCTLYDDGDMTCSKCKDGYFGPIYLCRSSMADRHCVSTWSSSYDICEDCEEGYELVKGSDRYCVPSKTCTDATRGENCATCSASACTACMAGWSSPSTGCNVPCNTGIVSCTECSPTDPTVCTACAGGVAPYCLPGYSTSCGYNEVYGYYDGEECIRKECASPDPTIFNGEYGPKFIANVTCAHHGTCVEKDGAYSCSCTEGENRDPANKCATCLPGYVLQGDKCVSSSAPSCPEHCRVCDKSNKCLACNEGYTDKDNNCNKACTVAGCSLCDAANPAICLGCIRGMAYALWVPANNSYICQPVCDTCSDGTCTLMANNTGACFSHSYGGYVGTNYDVYAECSLRGTYDEEQGKCICDPYTTGIDCATCSEGAVLDTDTFKCVLDLTTGCPDCASGTRCANFKGNLICFPTSCVTGGGSSSKVCNGAGVCSDQGTCLCDDALMNPVGGCRSCISGYVWSAKENKCVPSSCLEGVGLIKFCTSCRAEDQTLCATCAGSYVPDLTGKKCVICGEFSTRNADGSECVCNDSTKKPNGANICAVPQCGSISNCKRCYSGDATLCGECNPGYAVSKDRRTCTACGPTEAVSPDGFGCMCAPGYEPAGDDQSKCIDPVCHKGDNKIPACVSCKAANPAECYSCHGGMVYDSASKTCGCPTGYAIDSNGVCSPDTCKSIPNCRLCYGPDSSRCGFCESPLIPNSARDACVCAPGMQLTSFGTCVIPICRLGNSAIPHCVRCNDYSTNYCSACEEPFGVNYYGTACECSGSLVESNAQTCVQPTCIVSYGNERGVPGCIVCDFQDSSKCATCAHPLTLDNETNSCEGCKEGEVPQSDGTCACPSGLEYSDERTCVVPTCKDADSYCLVCKASPNNGKCAQCGWSHIVSASTGACVCAPGNSEGDDGNCIVPACVSLVPDCAICRTSNPNTCASCTNNKVPSTDGTSCVCARGYELSDDDHTCIEPLCKQGATKVDYCAKCLLSDNTVCHSCTHNRVLSADKKSCDCPAGTAAGNDGTCIDPLCTKGSTAIANCITCSTETPTKCMACDKSMIPINNGAECACGSGHELIDGVCARPNCLQGSTTVPNCIRCGYVATQCIECSNHEAPVNNKCSTSNLSGGAVAGIVIAVVLVVAAVVVAVTIIMIRRKNGGSGSSRAKYVNMQGGEVSPSGSL